MTENSDLKMILFYSGTIFLLLSIFFHVTKKEKASLIFLFSSALSLFLFAAIMDPVLNVWDERFHALVAKNLMKHPLLPTLYDDPVVIMEYDRWDRFHIWLHKQPLFLWQIAASYKLFGVNEFALRLPGVVLSALTAWGIFRSGKILVNHNTGYYAALLFITSFYLFQLVSGWQIIDHNDLSFVAYVSLSLWCWIEYIHSGRKRWIIFIGIFSGFAILCKWLVGLLVYLGWGIYSLRKNKFKLKKYADIFVSFMITAAIVLPWQILILKWYPKEAADAYEFYSSKHFFEELEGHGGPWYYHFNVMSDLFGIIAPFLILPALFIFYRKTTNKNIYVSLLINTLFVYALFSLAQTKMPSFTFVLVLPVFLSLGVLFDTLESLVSKIKIQPLIIKTALVALIFWFAFSRIQLGELDKIHGIFSAKTECTSRLIQNKKIFKELKLPKNAVLFNVPGRHYVEAMFYSDYPAYNFTPTYEQYLDLKKKKRTIVLFPQLNNEPLPVYLMTDTSLLFVKASLVSCE